MATLVGQAANTDQIALPRSGDPTVSIVIAAASNAGLLANCLTSVARSVDRDFPLETILVLNDASEDVLALAHERVTGARLHHSRVNLGFGGASNLGCSLAKGEFVLLLHDDTRVEPGFLEPLLEAATTREEVGAVGSMIVSFGGSLQDCGCVLWRDGLTTPPWVGDPPSRERFRGVRPVDYCGSSSLLVRRATWRRVGGFDERFFPAYYNDVDLCMSIRKLGQTVVCDPRSVVHHRRWSSTDPYLRAFIVERNKQRFRSKWQAELGDYEPWHPESQDALLNALDRTRRRAERMRARHDRSPVGEQAANGEALNRPLAPADPGLSAHEQKFLLADVALKDAYSRELAEGLDRNAGELARQAAEIERQVGVVGRQEKQIAEYERRSRWLHERASTLDAVESGGWWRLRAKLLPLVRAGSWIRRRVGSRKPKRTLDM